LATRGMVLGEVVRLSVERGGGRGRGWRTWIYGAGMRWKMRLRAFIAEERRDLWGEIKQ